MLLLCNRHGYYASKEEEPTIAHLNEPLVLFFLSLTLEQGGRDPNDVMVHCGIAGTTDMIKPSIHRHIRLKYQWISSAPLELLNWREE